MLKKMNRRAWVGSVCNGKGMRMSGWILWGSWEEGLLSNCRTGDRSEYLSHLGPCVSSSALVVCMNVVDFKTSVMCGESVLKLQVLRFLSCVSGMWYHVTGYVVFYVRKKHWEPPITCCRVIPWDQNSLLKWRWLCLLFCLWCKEIAAILLLQN